MNKHYLVLFIFLLLSLSATTLAQEVRSIDGSNNNLSHPDWGALGSRLAIPAGLHFADGVQEPNGYDRPNPRNISNAIFSQDGYDLPDPMGLSDYCWAFGQLLDHDVILVGENEEVVDIIIPKGDEYFDPFSSGEAKIHILRTVYDPTTGTDYTNPRQFNNEVTHWIDASFLYGSDEQRAAWLRTFENGKLKVSEGNHLPFNTKDGEYNSPIDNDAPFMAYVVHYPGPHKYYVAGDVRANENILLTALHTLFLREHNRIADSISYANQNWDDEAIYQKTRRLVIGLMQHITFDEWLPEIGIFPPDYIGPDPDINPAITNTFSVAAYRIGHSLISETFWRLDSNGDTSVYGNIPLKHAYFRSDHFIRETGLDPILRGMAAHTQQACDAKIVSGVRNFLFGDPGASGQASTGLDLAAVNIQRGRERGLPDYNSVRQAFGLHKITHFEEITTDPAKLAQIKAVYQSFDEIDVWPGLLLEDRIPNKIMGETMYAILTRQFLKLRDADRFFYLNDKGLTKDEIEWINNSYLADLITRNSGIKLMQKRIIAAMPADKVIVDHIDMPTDHLSTYVLPNPVSGTEPVYLIVSSPNEAEASVSIINPFGAEISQQTVQLSEGKTTILLPPQDYDNGIYLALIRTDSEKASAKIVVQK